MLMSWAVQELVYERTHAGSSLEAADSCLWKCAIPTAGLDG